MSDLRRMQFLGVLQGGVMACIASIVASLLLGKPIAQGLIISGFLIGAAVTILTLSISWWTGFHGRGTGEGIACLGYVLVLIAGVAVALFR